MWAESSLVDLNKGQVPSVYALEKMARALEVPMHRLFTDDEHVERPNIPAEASQGLAVRPKHGRELRALAKLLALMNDKDRGTLLHVASKVANRA